MALTLRRSGQYGLECGEGEDDAHLGGVGDDVVRRGELEGTRVPALAVVEEVEVEVEAEERRGGSEGGSNEGEGGGGDGEGLHGW